MISMLKEKELINELEQMEGIKKIYKYQQEDCIVFWIINKYGVAEIDILKIIAHMENIISIMKENRKNKEITYELFPHNYDSNLRKILDSMKVNYNV